MAVYGLRRSALISVYGPGSLVDFRSDHAPISCIIKEYSNWGSEPSIEEPRLAALLNTESFRQPPVDFENNIHQTQTIIEQFPKWLQCPNCKRIGHLKSWQPLSISNHFDRYCTHCSNSSRKYYCIPIRFISYCKKGHISDFPWHSFVNHSEQCNNKSLDHQLILRSNGPSISDIFVSCPSCQASKPLIDAYKKTSFNCLGDSPWKDYQPDSSKCDQKLKITQRGSSSVYYPIHQSAISIPPWSSQIETYLKANYQTILGIEDPSQRKQFIEFLANAAGTPTSISIERGKISIENLIKHFDDLHEYSQSEKDSLSLKAEEYSVLSDSVTTEYNSDDFIANPIELPSSLCKYFRGVSEIKRLREVRALVGFTRVDPTQDKQFVQSISSKESASKWLPAIENFGEGIFIDFNTTLLKEWAIKPSVKQHFSSLTLGFFESLIADGQDVGVYKKLLRPEFYLIHTLSHLLIRNLSTKCGYSSASIRERVYSFDNADSGCSSVNGLLLYTSSTDSDGSLGGLCGMAKNKNFEILIADSLRDGAWCSSDPLCISRHNVDFLTASLASCHNCTLVPETSCEYFNSFLDRSFLFGNSICPDIAFFEPNSFS